MIKWSEIKLIIKRGKNKLQYIITHFVVPIIVIIYIYNN